MKPRSCPNTIPVSDRGDELVQLLLEAWGSGLTQLPVCTRGSGLTQHLGCAVGVVQISLAVAWCFRDLPRVMQARASFNGAGLRHLARARKRRRITPTIIDVYNWVSLVSRPAQGPCSWFPLHFLDNEPPRSKFHETTLHGFLIGMGFFAYLCFKP